MSLQTIYTVITLDLRSDSYGSIHSGIDTNNLFSFSTHDKAIEHIISKYHLDENKKQQLIEKSTLEIYSYDIPSIKREVQNVMILTSTYIQK